MSVMKILIPHEAEMGKENADVTKAAVLTIKGYSYRDCLKNMQELFDSLCKYTNVEYIGLRLEDENGNQITAENEEFAFIGDRR